MGNIEWKYADDSVTEEFVRKIGGLMGIKFPKDYIDCAKENHGANVMPYCMDVEGIERVFGSLLSFDKESSDYIVNDYHNYRVTLPNGVVPFGIDPAGNLICFDYKDHEEHLNIVNYLVQNGIDITVKYTGDTMKDMGAYEFAIERGQVEIAEYLKMYT
ncbi:MULTISPECIES: SMI1/KNR4 family protein [Bacillus]|uniref:SMI1/KNR4 family protein n=1 Tax=Bacillus TaxID=1386 RepID=UPI000BF15BCF|nr:SMI1/KNR4 family protein [Bacillus mycoides]PEK92896.1 1,3-beta-glucan synthase regulator [Bacillus mycoides]QWG83890.1 SMI1/KNR4 family protein [Bacillus mycoides]